jgi:hypothetical protein
MKAVLAVALALAASPQALADCSAVNTAQPSDAPVLLEGFDLIAASSQPGLMARPNMPEGADAIVCYRESIVPEPNDFELVRYHEIPLMIRLDKDGRPPALLIMAFRPEQETADGEIIQSQYIAQLPQGEVTQAEADAINASMASIVQREAALLEEMAQQGQVLD